MVFADRMHPIAVKMSFWNRFWGVEGNVEEHPAGGGAKEVEAVVGEKLLREETEHVRAL